MLEKQPPIFLLASRNRDGLTKWRGRLPRAFVELVGWYCTKMLIRPMWQWKMLTTSKDGRIVISCRACKAVISWCGVYNLQITVAITLFFFIPLVEHKGSLCQTHKPRTNNIKNVMKWKQNKFMCSARLEVHKFQLKLSNYNLVWGYENFTISRIFQDSR